ncbi:hypothetical protein PMIN07_009310 [Paraphaeosphaeria minitans]
MSSTAPPIPMPTAAPVPRPPGDACGGMLVSEGLVGVVAEEDINEEEEAVVVRSEAENVLKNVGSISETQHVWHVLFAHLHSRTRTTSHQEYRTPNRDRSHFRCCRCLQGNAPPKYTPLRLRCWYAMHESRKEQDRYDRGLQFVGFKMAEG